MEQGKQRRRYYSTNDKDRVAFIERKRNGLSLSDNVWDYTRPTSTPVVVCTAHRT